MTPSPTVVRHVRWSAAPPGTAARGALERWLAALDVRHYGLPAAAILVVRRAQAPLPVLGGRSAHDPLAAAVRGARRPALEGDAPADAVWFADEAELLACLARDGLHGGAGTRWWWPLVGAGLDGTAAVTCWIAAPRAAPTALQRLGRDAARRWLTRWSARETGALADALVRVFALPSAVAQAVRGRAAAADEPETAAPVTSSDRPEAFAPSAPGTDTPDAVERLWRLCEALTLAPWSAASPALVDAWRPPQPAAAPAEGAAGPAAAPAAATTTHPAADARAPVASATRLATARHDPLDAPRRADTAHREDAAMPPAWRAPPAEPAADTAPPAARDDTAARTAGVLVPHDAPAPTDPLATAHGGLFFVLNAALALGLYGDFTQPRHAGLALSPWRLLHACARAALGRRFEADPLAAWLRARDPAPPAAGDAALLRAATTRLARRIGRALDRPPRHAMRLTLALPARLHDSGTRLDLHFALAALPLPLRVAGLDRDPGWLPAAGCDLRFHFD